jgi:ribosome-associated protein
MEHLDKEKLIKETKVHFARSGGKGGQNVNKVETKVELTFNIAHSALFDEDTKRHLLDELSSKIDHEGNLHVTASSERYQHSNRRKAEEKLIDLLNHALEPKKTRIATRPSGYSKMARVLSKRKKSEKKKARSKQFDESY